MVQYYPRVDAFSPAAGSFAGGTQLTIDGGGFSMAEEDVEVCVSVCECCASVM